jgi:hypothetical protein
MAVAQKPTVCCDVTPCSLVDTQCGCMVNTHTCITSHKTLTKQTINVHFNIISQTIPNNSRYSSLVFYKLLFVFIQCAHHAYTFCIHTVHPPCIHILYSYSASTMHTHFVFIQCIHHAYIFCIHTEHPPCIHISLSIILSV